MFCFVSACRKRRRHSQHRPTFEQLDDRLALAAPVAVNDTYTIVEGQSVHPGSFPANALVWRTQDGGNGHAYLGVSEPGTVNWTSARAAAEALGGHLATITSQAEANFINANLALDRGWLGGYQDRTAPDFTEPAGGWRWITGEAWSFTNWRGAEPNESRQILEDFVESVRNSGWNDHPDWYGVIPGYYVEFPAAANVLTNDVDADGDTLSAILVSNVRNGTLDLSPNGSFTYTPNAGFSGVETFTYRANDGFLDSNGMLSHR
jgi:hypothetical protein